MSKAGRVRGRSPVTYNHKINRLQAWYNRRLKYRQILLDLANTLRTKSELDDKEKRTLQKVDNLKEMHPLEWYTEKIKKVGGKGK